MAAHVIKVKVADEDLELLLQLTGDGLEHVARNVPELLEHLARSLADGVRRIQQATGWSGS